MFETKMAVSGISVGHLTKMLDKFSKNHAVVYKIRKLENGVELEIKTPSGKAMRELYRRLSICETKSSNQLKVELVSVEGETQ